MIDLLPRMAATYALNARRGALRRPLCRFSNLVPDAGLDLIGSDGDYLDTCQVGRSNVLPQPAQTQLLEPLAGTAVRTAANSGASGSAPWRGFSQITYLFDVGAITDEIREIGVGPSATPGDPIFSRALVRNAFGQPASVRLQADEALEVEYELSVYAPASDVTGTLMVNGAEHSFVARAALASTPQHWAPYRSDAFESAGQAVHADFEASAGAHAVAFDGPIGAVTSSPGGSSGQASAVIAEPYDAGSFVRRCTVEFWLYAPNLSAGIRSLMLRMRPGTGLGGNSLGAYQIEFDPVIAKVPGRALELPLGLSWGRL